ncbi:MAG: DUF1027 domain-containing protein [Firmicutes bacterium]|nr:DUF1027 domain-containing protein [Bacillota bacterium]
MEIILNNYKYIVEKDDFNSFEKSLVEERITDYFEPYDYIFGDFSYGRVRFKGFYESNNKNCTKINDIKYLNEYINNYCSFGCKWFLLKKCGKATN